MSEMKKNLDFTVIRQQVRDVTEVLSHNDLLYPISRKNWTGEGERIESELVQHLVKFEGLWFIRNLNYKDAQIHFQIQMTDVTTDGMKMNMTPVIAFVLLTKSPANTDNQDLYPVEKLCNAAAKKALVT